MDKKYYFYHFICQFDRSLFKTRDPESKHKTFIYLTAISIELAQSLQRNCRKPLKSSVSGIRAQKDHKTATPFDKTEVKNK